MPTAKFGAELTMPGSHTGQVPCPPDLVCPCRDGGYPFPVKPDVAEG